MSLSLSVPRGVLFQRVRQAAQTVTTWERPRRAGREAVRRDTRRQPTEGATVSIRVQGWVPL